MNIVIVGPGALGSLFAARLTEAGVAVLLLDHRPERADFIEKRGVVIEQGGHERRVRVRISSLIADTAHADLLLVCVKAHATAKAVKPLLPFLKEDARILTLQNGLGNVEALVELWGAARVWGGTTAQGATELGLGQIRHAGQGDTVLAAVQPTGEEQRLAAVADLFSTVGLPTRVERDVDSLIWSKVIVNAGINPLTAITRLRNGQLLDFPGTRETMAAAVAEAVAVSQALGIKLLYPDPLARVRQVATATASNVASMLQDILAKRPTEIDYINGAIAALGRQVGRPAPVNQTLTDLIRTIESSYGLGV